MGIIWVDTVCSDLRDEGAHFYKSNGTCDSILNLSLNPPSLSPPSPLPPPLVNMTL